MKLLISIDRRAALAQGIDAPHSTAEVDIDPATLTPEERAILAEAMADDGFTVMRNVDTGYGFGPLRAVTADVSGVRAALAELLARRGEAAAKRAEIEAQDAATIEAIRAEAARAPITDLYRRTIRNGAADVEPVTISQYHNYARHGGLSAFYTRGGGTLAELTGRDAELRAEMERQRQNMERQREQQETAAAKARAEQDAAYAALLQRLPEGLQGRAREGYATDDEVHAAIRALLITDAGYPVHLAYAYDDWAGLDALTDAEYEQMRTLRDEAPAGAEVRPVVAWHESADDPAVFSDESDGLDATRGVLIRLASPVPKIRPEVFIPFAW